jgi:hypothetical protein
MSIKKQFFAGMTLIFLTLGLSISIQNLLAWTAPVAMPPSINVARPIDQSSVDQQKLGNIKLNTGGVIGDNGLFIDYGSLVVGASSNSTDYQVYIKNQVVPNYGLYIERENGGMLGGIYESSSHDASLYLRSSGNITTSINAVGSSYLMGGNLGIGTSSPLAKLHVYTATGDIAAGIETGNSGIALLKFKNSTGSGQLEFGRNSNSLGWYSNTAASQVFTINNSNGNVGIGSTSPSEKLSVAGNIKSSGNICDGAGNCLHNAMLNDNYTYSKTDTCFPGDQVIAYRTIANTCNGGYYDVDSGMWYCQGTCTTAQHGWGPNNTVETCGYQDYSGSCITRTCNATRLALCKATIPTGCENLYGGRWTTCDCIGYGGTVLTDGSDKYCSLNAASCPSAWSQFKNWSRTTARTCANGSCASACTTGAHVWGNTATEACGYDAGYSGFAWLCGYGATGICYANYAQIGCY